MSTETIYYGDLKVDGKAYVKNTSGDGYIELNPQSVEDYTFTQFIGKVPAYYQREKFFVPNHTNITIKANTQLNINGSGYVTTEDILLNLSTVGTADNLKGKDVYIYACQKSSTELEFKLSLNSTYPDGYNADTSRKIGGFHCLCAATGDLGTLHPLSNYAAGDILPESVWDLNFHPKSSPEGMTYIKGIHRFADIYLASYEGTGVDLILKSVYNGVVADGVSTEKFDWYKFAYYFGKQKKYLPKQQEFINMSLGSNLGTNIKGGTDPNTTGGHLDTANRRCISYAGCEDACGVYWQWGDDTGSTYGDNWGTAYNSSIHPSEELRGDCYWQPRRVRFGGLWAYSSRCGPLSANWDVGASYLFGSIAARGFSEAIGCKE